MELHGIIFDFGGVLTDLGDPPEFGDPPLFRVVHAARAAGIKVGLLSNADARQSDPGWAGLFDAVVLSGEVGMAKPDVEIYMLAAAKLGLSAQKCVFVDDLPRNVRGAVDAGMVGVVHQAVSSTVSELEVLFDRKWLV